MNFEEASGLVFEEVASSVEEKWSRMTREW
jgi:hypothetical protein